MESEVMSDAVGAGGITASGSGTVGSSSEQAIPPPDNMKSSRYGIYFIITCGIKELKIFDEFKKLRNEFTGFLRKFQYPFALRGRAPKTDFNRNIRFVL